MTGRVPPSICTASLRHTPPPLFLYVSARNSGLPKRPAFRILTDTFPRATRIQLGAHFRTSIIAITQVFGYNRMPTIFRVGRLRIAMYPNDHRPPHVHVLGPDAWAKVMIGDGGSAPWASESSGLTRKEVLEVLVAVAANQADLLLRWREIHGDA